MPIVISELVFRAQVSTSVEGMRRAPGTDPRQAIDKKEIVEACVEEVMRILERKKER